MASFGRVFRFAQSARDAGARRHSGHAANSRSRRPVREDNPRPDCSLRTVAGGYENTLMSRHFSPTARRMVLATLPDLVRLDALRPCLATSALTSQCPEAATPYVGTIVHHVLGRVRLRMPLLRRSPRLAHSLVRTWLRLPGVFDEWRSQLSPRVRSAQRASELLGLRARRLRRQCGAIRQTELTSFAGGCPPSRSRTRDPITKPTTRMTAARHAGRISKAASCTTELPG